MDSKPTPDKTDPAEGADSYNESLEWIRAMNAQLKSPGRFVSKKLESASLEQVHRELSSLLLTGQSHGSALLRAAFTNANSYNDDLKKIIMSLWPVKEKVSEFHSYLKGVRDETEQMSEAVKHLLNRLHTVLYAKMAIETILQADENLGNLCEELVATFAVLHAEDPGPRHGSKLSHVVGLIEAIAKKAYRMNTLIQSIAPEYNLESNWMLLEFAPNELNKIRRLVAKFRAYDAKLGEMLEASQRKRLFLARHPNLGFESNLQVALALECQLDPGTADALAEFSLAKFEADVETLSKALGVLVEVCASVAFTKLYRLYTELRAHRLTEILTQDNTAQKDGLLDEIHKYLAALVSILRGHERLSAGDLAAMVAIFNDAVVAPCLEAANLLQAGGESPRGFMGPQEEASNFAKFVDDVEQAVLNPANSVLAEFLDDLAAALGDDAFRRLCVLGPVATAVLAKIDEGFPSVFAPASAESYAQNYRAFERLLTALETHADAAASQLYRWRGTALPQSYVVRLATGAFAEKRIHDVCAEFYAELERHHELDGTQHSAGGRRFYVASTQALYRQTLELFAEAEFVRHLFPQYLKAAGDMFRAYACHVDAFVLHMESANREGANARGGALWPSGLSFAYSTYVLHDVIALLDCLRTGSLEGIAARAAAGDPELGAEFGSLAGVLIAPALKPLALFRAGRSGARRAPSLAADKDSEFASSLANVTEFTDRAVHALGEVVEHVRCQVGLARDKLVSRAHAQEHYIVNALHASAKCSLQLIQALESKFRTGAKQAPDQVSDYVRFLVAPMSSFAEFSRDVVADVGGEHAQETLARLMLRTVELVSADYASHVGGTHAQLASLLKSVDTRNASLTNAKNAALSEYSGSLLIVDAAALRRQIARDVGEFYETCAGKFGVDRAACAALERLLEFRVM